MFVINRNEKKANEKKEEERKKKESSRNNFLFIPKVYMWGSELCNVLLTVSSEEFVHMASSMAGLTVTVGDT